MSILRAELVHVARLRADHFTSQADPDQVAVWGTVPRESGLAFDLGDLTFGVRRGLRRGEAVDFAPAVSMHVKRADGPKIGSIGLWKSVDADVRSAQVGWMVGDGTDVISLHGPLEEDGRLYIGRALAGQHGMELDPRVSNDHGLLDTSDPLINGENGGCRLVLHDVSKHGLYFYAPANGYNAMAPGVYPGE